METFDADPDAERDRVYVGVSEYVVAADDETLVAYGVGSCVAVLLWDPDAGVGGVANAVLPERAAGDDVAAAKFVDSATEALLRELVEAGASYATVEGRVVGGATIMTFEDLGEAVGADNVAAARATLERLEVPVVAEATGGDHGRTVEFDTATGEARVHTAFGDGPEPL